MPLLYGILTCPQDRCVQNTGLPIMVLYSLPVTSPPWRRGVCFSNSVFLYQLAIVNDLVIFPSHSAPHCEARLNTRSANSVQLVRPFSMTDSYKQSFFPDAVYHWNQLLRDIKSASSLCTFKYHLNYSNCITWSLSLLWTTCISVFYVLGHILCTSYIATYVVLAFNSWCTMHNFHKQKKNK